MPTSYTSLLGLALPVTGELSGAWGNTVNDSITSLLDTAVAGTTTLSSDADVTLSTTTGAANQARQAVILWTAGGTVTRNITAPAASKAYVVINKTSSTQSIVIRGVGPTTGVTVRAGQQALVVWDGLDFVEVASGNVDGPASSTDNAVVRFDGTTGKLIQNSTATIDDSGNFVATGNVNSSAATATVFSTPTNLTVGAAATTLSLGAATGTAAINNTTVTASNATTVSLGAATGTTSINNATVTLGNATTLNMNGANPTVASTATGTLTLFNTALTTANAFGAATTIALGITGTTARTVNIATGATSASTFTFGGAATSATHVIKIGTGSGGTATFDAGNAGSIGRLFPTITTGAINIAAGQTTGSLAVMGAQTSGTFTLGGTASTGAITIGQSTGAQTINIGTGVNTAATKTINIGTNGTTGTTAIRIGTDGANLRLPFHTDLGNSTQLWSAADYVLALGDIGAIRATTGSVAVTKNVYYNGTNFVQTDGSQSSDLAYFYLGGLQTKYAAPGGTSGAAVTMNDVWSLSYNGLIGYSQGGANVSLTCAGADLEVYDDNFAFANNTDATKKAFFDASGITTGTTRTYTLPNINGTLATLANISQTFTGQTSIIPATNSASITIGAIPQTGTITLGRSQATHTMDIGAGPTLSGNTKTINFGTAGVSGSTTNINIGPSDPTAQLTGTQILYGPWIASTALSPSYPTKTGLTISNAETGTFTVPGVVSAIFKTSSQDGANFSAPYEVGRLEYKETSGAGAPAPQLILSTFENVVNRVSLFHDPATYRTYLGTGINTAEIDTFYGGSGSVAIGLSALTSVTSVTNPAPPYTVAIGVSAAYVSHSSTGLVTYGGHNIALGYESGRLDCSLLRTASIGDSNIFIGNSVGKVNADTADASIGTTNIFIGFEAGQRTDKSFLNNNIGIGFQAGTGLPSGTGNTVVIGAVAATFEPSLTSGDVLIGNGGGWALLQGDFGVSFFDSITFNGNQALALRNTGGLSFYDSEFKIIDNVDPTKVAVFDATGITTATTRTLTVPNASGTLALTSGTQTFSGTTTFSGTFTLSGTTSAISLGTSQTSGTMTIGGTAGTGTIVIGRSTGAQTLSLAGGATTSGTTKTVNIGTAGVSGSTTNINIGSAVSGATTTTAVSGNFTVQGVTVGLGGGAVSTNTAVGASALAAETTGTSNTAVGNRALEIANGGGGSNTAVGAVAMGSMTTGSDNVAIGSLAMYAATTGAANIAIGSTAMFNGILTGNYNTAIGTGAGNSLTSGSYNNFIGASSGSTVTTGSNNVIIGGYTGSAAPISATGSNWIVLSDGAGNVRQAIDATSVQSLTGAAVVYAPAPAATISALTTLTNAQILPQIVVTSGTSFTLTMPLGSTLETLVAWAGTNLGFEFSLINTASGTITMALNTGVTLVGTMTVLTGISARFRIRRTAANTFVLYRIG